MDARACARLFAATIAATAMAASDVGAFTMGEQMATTGIQGTLAGNGAQSAAPMLGTVKKSLSSSTAKMASHLPQGASGAGGRGRSTSGKTAAKSGSKGSGSGWGGATEGWAKSGLGGRNGAGGWKSSSGAWPQSGNWASNGNAWGKPGSGAWARPGNKAGGKG